MTETAASPEAEAKAAVIEQYTMVEQQQEEYGWESCLLDAGDYLMLFIRVSKPGGRSFLMRLRCDDYPEIAPELRFVNPEALGAPVLGAEPAAEFYPAGSRLSPLVSGARSRCRASRATATTTREIRRGTEAGPTRLPMIIPCTSSS